jgi:5-methylcytosine-specific restriction endonuclease McrA
MTDGIRIQVFERDGYQRGNRGVGTSDADIPCQHIVPVSRGGQDTVSNCVGLCAPCHNNAHRLEREANHTELIKHGQQRALEVWDGSTSFGHATPGTRFHGSHAEAVSQEMMISPV